MGLYCPYSYLFLNSQKVPKQHFPWTYFLAINHKLPLLSLSLSSSSPPQIVPAHTGIAFYSISRLHVGLDLLQIDEAELSSAFLWPWLWLSPSLLFSLFLSWWIPVFSWLSTETASVFWSVVFPLDIFGLPVFLSFCLAELDNQTLLWTQRVHFFYPEEQAQILKCASKEQV